MLVADPKAAHPKAIDLVGVLRLFGPLALGAARQNNKHQDKCNSHVILPPRAGVSGELPCFARGH